VQPRRVGQVLLHDRLDVDGPRGGQAIAERDDERDEAALLVDRHHVVHEECLLPAGDHVEVAAPQPLLHLGVIGDPDRLLVGDRRVHERQGSRLEPFGAARTRR